MYAVTETPDCLILHVKKVMSNSLKARIFIISDSITEKKKKSRNYM